MKKFLPFELTENTFLIPGQLNKNNFDFIRFILASAVIYSHSFAIFHGVVIDTEPVSICTHNQVDLGSIAVCFFFVISGFLIVKSFEFSSSIYQYLIKRILRICPGFYVAFLVSVLILGLAGTIDADHKFGNWSLYWPKLAIRRMIVNLFSLEAPKGAKTFVTNPLPGMINEAFWTIQYEFICYLLVPLFAIVSMLNRKWLSILIFATAYIVFILQTLNYITITDNEKRLVLLFPSELPRLLSFFFAGSCVYFYRNRIVRSKLLMVLSVAAVLFACWWGRGLNLVLPIAGSYLLFYFAYHPKIQLYDFAKHGDFSYGLYLYGWPIQQLIVYFFAKQLDAYRVFFIAYPLVFIAAYLSWHFVEAPFLKMKDQIKKMSFLKQKKAVIV